MLKVKGYIKQWLPLVAFLLITTACQEEGVLLSGDESGARIPLKVSAMLATSDANATEEELLVRSAFVFIYNTEDKLENAGETEVPVNKISSVNGKINISYEWLISSGEKNIYVVLNPPSREAEWLKQTPSISELHGVIASDFSIYETGVIDPNQGGLMSGYNRAKVTGSSFTTVPIYVFRRYARLELYFRKSPELSSVKTRISSVTLNNYSSEVLLFHSFPEWNDGNWNRVPQTGYHEQLIDSESYVRYYRHFYMMPRPVQASLTGGIPMLDIEIETKEGTLGYTIPLTEELDRGRPLSIEGNTIYRMNITLTPRKEDVRVELTVLPWEEDTPQKEYINGELREHTNCYVVEPGGEARIPVASVYKIWNWFLKDPIPADKKVKAELIWSDTPGLISSVTVEKGYDMMSQALIRVKTADPSLRGNAVIGMKVDGESDYRWSWHVWVTTTEVLSEASTEYAPGTFLRANLGSLADPALIDPSSGNDFSDRNRVDFGLLYQWGRKDPFPSSIDGNEPLLYGKTNEERPVVQFESVKDQNNILNAIHNPLVFYTSAIDWSTTNSSISNNQLWSNSFKSIYDPCPYGWRVTPIEGLPLDRVNNDAVSRYWATTDGIRYMTEVFGFLELTLLYPCAGYRDGVTGSFINPNRDLYYWSSSTERNYSTAMSGSWRENDDVSLFRPPLGRSHGLPVRCVKNN